jgi:hypothetical protein
MENSELAREVMRDICVRETIGATGGAAFR